MTTSYVLFMIKALFGLEYFYIDRWGNAIFPVQSQVSLGFTPLFFTMIAPCFYLQGKFTVYPVKLL